MEKKLKIIFSIVIFLVWPSFSLGAPSISGVSGELSHGQVITISGVDFGSKSQATPVVWDDFESGIVGQNSVTPAIGSNWYNGGNVFYEGEILREGSSKSTRHDFTTEGVYNAALTKNGGPWGELYISFFYRTDYGNLNAYYEDPCRNYKVFRMEGDNGLKSGDQGEGVPLISYEKRASTTGIGLFETALRAQYEPVTYSGTFYGGDHPRSPIGWANQEWHRVELYVNVLDGKKEFRMWEDSLENTPLKTSDGWLETFYPYMGEDNSRFNELHFGIYFSRDNGASAYTYMDDIYVDETIAHIEIGNAPNYDACTHREIQIPSAWSANSITATINQGSFSNGAMAYLYVVDANGEVNADGFPIVINSSDAIAPSNPTGLIIL
ncbi:MAG: hypothetical protein V3574_00100 [Candidatus Moraniibacteriota bacterium]